MPDYPPIQIVDKDDRPIRGAGLSETFHQGLIHRIVYILVEDAHGRILLQLRGPKVATFPNCWDVAAAGYVDEGEEYEAAAIRELQEELGVSVAHLKEVDRFYKESQHDGLIRNRFCRVYRAVVDPATEFKIAADETTEVRWVSQQEIKQFLAEHSDRIADGLHDTLERHYEIWKSLA